MSAVLDAVGLVLVTAGCFLALTAGIAQHRFPDVASRAHAAAKPQVLGLVLVLLGVAATLREPVVTTLAAVAVGLQLATSPLGSHTVARSSHRYGHLDDAVLRVDDLSHDIASGDLARPDPAHEPIGDSETIARPDSTGVRP
jgi:multicomponent Na+:H+ antiporter subunit G